jgi:vacuolar protein sorting-associated protein 13A/C
VVLNKTGLEINIKSKSMLQQAKSAAGQGVRTRAGEGESRKALPYMFSYASEDRQNRAILRVGDSSWSKAQSFEAIGSTTEVVLPSSTKHTEIHVGISVDEGEGKVRFQIAVRYVCLTMLKPGQYKMTKVVTLAPRFILKSKMDEEINVREPGSPDVMTLAPDQLLPLHFLRQTSNKQLCLCFPGLNNQWYEEKQAWRDQHVADGRAGPRPLTSPT